MVLAVTPGGVAERVHRDQGDRDVLAVTQGGVAERGVKG